MTIAMADRFRRIRRFAKLSVLFLGIAVIVLEMCAVLNLYSFEYEPIFKLLGWRGYMLLTFFNFAIALIVLHCSYSLRNHPIPGRRFVLGYYGASALLCLWVLQYLFMETPLTVRIRIATLPDDAVLDHDQNSLDFSSFSLAGSAPDREAQEELRTMYSRIRINNPSIFRTHPLGATIDKYAERYDIDPLFLFFRAYINSFYGEAVSGPLPFVQSMTSETFRDLVQIHLPSWFVESSARRRLTTSDVLSDVAGEQLGFKLRYALHKATLDVSTQPYDVSTFSDVMLVLKEFPEEFDDVLANPTPNEIQHALRKSFEAIEANALLPPYESPYQYQTYGNSYYSANRDSLRRFARAAYYNTVFDFDFATRVQALLSAYQRRYYHSHLGAECWVKLPAWQRLIMLAMVRDLYTPNVGHLGYNLYALPELNSTPVRFVVEQAQSASGLAGCQQETAWIPEDSDYLWAGASYQLRVLNEVWTVVHGKPIPGLSSADTTLDALNIILAVDNER